METPDLTVYRSNGTTRSITLPRKPCSAIAGLFAYPSSILPDDLADFCGKSVFFCLLCSSWLLLHLRICSHASRMPGPSPKNSFHKLYLIAVLRKHVITSISGDSITERAAALPYGLSRCCKEVYCLQKFPSMLACHNISLKNKPTRSQTLRQIHIMGDHKEPSDPCCFSLIQKSPNSS